MLSRESNLEHLEWLRQELAKALAVGKKNRATQVQKDITRYERMLVNDKDDCFIKE